MKQYITYLSHVLFQRFYSIFFIWLSTFILQQVSQTFFGTGCMGWKRKKNHALESGCLCFVVGYFDMSEMIIFQQEEFLISPAGYSYDYTLATYVVLSPANGGAPIHRFWMQPFSNGRTWYLQLIWLVAWYMINMLMTRHDVLLRIFRWVIHVSTLSDPWIVSVPAVFYPDLWGFSIIFVRPLIFLLIKGCMHCSMQRMRLPLLEK
jgi:hypothetical protein